MKEERSDENNPTTIQNGELLFFFTHALRFANNDVGEQTWKSFETQRIQLSYLFHDVTDSIPFEATH